MAMDEREKVEEGGRGGQAFPTSVLCVFARPGDSLAVLRCISDIIYLLGVFAAGFRTVQRHDEVVCVSWP